MTVEDGVASAGLPPPSLTTTTSFSSQSQQKQKQKQKEQQQQQQQQRQKELLYRLEGEEPYSALNASTTKKIESALAELSNFANTSEPYSRNIFPIFFHIPKSSGSTVRSVMWSCHLFTVPTETRIRGKTAMDTYMDIHRPRITMATEAVVRSEGGEEEDNNNNNNKRWSVNMSSVHETIDRSLVKGQVRFGWADAIVTKFPFESNDFFTPPMRGRLFAVFRHPVDRAISLFNYLQIADWEITYSPELKNWTLEQFANSHRSSPNWLTRFLSHNYQGNLTDDHLAIAMHVVETKFIVGLITELGESMERFEQLFRWTFRVDPQYQEKCRHNFIHGEGVNRNTKKRTGKRKYQPGDKEYDILANQNRYDIILYEHVEKLFREQATLFSDYTPSGFRNENATCCTCPQPSYPQGQEQQLHTTCPT